MPIPLNIERAYSLIDRTYRTALSAGISRDVIGSALLNQGLLALLDGGNQSHVAEALEKVAAEIRQDAYRLGPTRGGPGARPRLVIVDDVFPVLQSGFRVAEYNFYLERFPDAEVLSTAASFPLLSEQRSFEAVVAEYEQAYPHLQGRVRLANGKSHGGAALGYTIFLNNAFAFLPYFEATHTPFVFTLYPGGGLHLGEAEANHRLRAVTSSPMFRRVIVTQSITGKYLIEGGFCRPEQIVSIFGCVASPRLPASPDPKRRYGVDKATFDLCFIANKYTSSGRDKGWDVFVEVARRLCRLSASFKFHVAGGFGPHDADFEGMSDRFQFYGGLRSDQLPDFFSDMDLILSANEPAVYTAGAFDGFPTGCCSEAALNGVAVMCTDPLGLNGPFVDGFDICLVDRDVEAVTKRIEAFLEQPESLRRLALNGQRTSSEVYSAERQLEPREQVLRAALAANSASAAEVKGPT